MPGYKGFIVADSPVSQTGMLERSELHRSRFGFIFGMGGVWKLGSVVGSRDGIPSE